MSGVSLADRIAQLHILSPPPCARIRYASKPSVTKTDPFTIAEGPVKTARTTALGDTPGAEAVALWRACLADALGSPVRPDRSFEPVPAFSRAEGLLPSSNLCPSRGRTERSVYLISSNRPYSTI